ncbi:MAG: L-threonylcarbamoyladenylate synthase [bacterium]|nr:L-threonylcarbamoyladenylate synthase [bacterium]
MKKIEGILLRGGIGVLLTDTIYGLVGSALSKMAVERIYKVRKRNSKKPFIILISSVKDLNYFGVKLDQKTKALLKKIWPGPVSVILPCSSGKFYFLHRGTKILAFRLPKLNWLRNLLRKTGPLVAPSANPEGLPPAKTIKEAKKYFGNEADFYVNGGQQAALPSSLVRFKNGQILIEREGQGLYQCPECKMHYFNKATARQCENWCHKHKSCNLDIIKIALESARAKI